MVAMSAPEASADQGAIESPFTKVEDFASDIKDYVGSVADKAEKEAARKQRAADRAAVVAEADDQLGVPYVYGGTTPSGFDCSGFTRWVYEHALGIDLPRTAAEQSALGKSVSMDELKPGDLLYIKSIDRLGRRRRRVHPRFHRRRPGDARHLRLLRAFFCQASHLGQVDGRGLTMTPLINENSTST